MRDGQKRKSQQERLRAVAERQEPKSTARKTGEGAGHRRPGKRGFQGGRGWPAVVPLTHR